MKSSLLVLALGFALAAGAANVADAGGRGKCRGKCPPVPEIDIFSGLAAIGTLGGAGALVLERRRRRSATEV